MNRLLASGFSRMKKEKAFWYGLVLMTIYAVYLCIFNFYEMKRSSYADYALDDFIFDYNMFLGIYVAVICSMFIGTEYSEGTIRNKLIVGCRRGHVYLSNLIVCSVAGILGHLPFLIVMLCLGIPLFGGFEIQTGVLLGLIACSWLVVFSYAGIFTLLAMLKSNKAANAVTSVLLAVLLIVAAGAVESALREPEYVDFFSWSVGGSEELSEDLFEPQRQPNPRYLSGAKREAYQFVYDFLPSGQAMQMITQTGEHMERWPFCSLGIIIVTTVGGIVLFSRKDLK